MPNHTTNFVTIETNTNVQEEIKALEELKNDLRIKADMFYFNGIVPMPEEIKKGASLDFHNKDEDYINVMGVYVPKDEQNIDYQAILAWVAEGNTIEPADE